MSASILPRDVQRSDTKEPLPALRIGGVVPFSATDYPGKLALVLFSQGCPWRCHYCHNPHLQPVGESTVAWLEVLSLLKRRVGLIDAVVFSGGEPTHDPALLGAIEQVRELGFLIGLHTAGIYPRRLKEILLRVDWVGLDIKMPFLNYEAVTTFSNSGSLARASAEIVLASDVVHEFRTTIHPQLMDEEVIFNLAEALSRMGVKNYALQVFRAGGCQEKNLCGASVAGFPSESLVKRVGSLFPSFVLRREE